MPPSAAFRFPEFGGFNEHGCVSLVFAPMGLIAGAIAAGFWLSSPVGRRRAVWWGYLAAAPVAFFGSLMSGLLYSGLVGPILYGVPPLALGAFVGSCSVAARSRRLTPSDTGLHITIGRLRADPTSRAHAGVRRTLLWGEPRTQFRGSLGLLCSESSGGARIPEEVRSPRPTRVADLGLSTVSRPPGQFQRSQVGASGSSRAPEGCIQRRPHPQ